MSLSRLELERFLATNRQVVLVEISRALGSTPREMGAFMLVSGKEMLGTIGGGQLEYIALDSARRMLKTNHNEHQLEVVLGPETGQCCGGHVTLGLRRVNAVVAEKLRQRMEQQVAQYRQIYIMGAGHVGGALAQALAPLPFKTIVVDTRKEALERFQDKACPRLERGWTRLSVSKTRQNKDLEPGFESIKTEKALGGLPENIETRLSVLPEAEVRAAPQGSAFVVLTHDHALDFLIAREALRREDACYVGMIGSKSKRASFASWLRGEGHAPEDIKRLICPIGGDKVNDKRPEIIAALVVAEILLHTQQQQSDKIIVQREVAGIKSGGEKTGVK